MDPVMPTWERDLSVLSELALKLTFTAATHIHADHITSALHFAATERRIRYVGLFGYALAALLLALSPAMLARAAQGVTAREVGARVAAGLPACAQCHGPNGEGQPASGFPRLCGAQKLMYRNFGMPSDLDHARTAAGAREYSWCKPFTPI